MCWSPLGVYPGPEEMHTPITVGDTSPFKVFGETQYAFMATSTVESRAHAVLWMLSGFSGPTSGLLE